MTLYSEALFRTLKYRPEYPERAFEDLAAARTWVEGFVRWYNTEQPAYRDSGARRNSAINDKRQKLDAASTP